MTDQLIGLFRNLDRGCSMTAAVKTFNSLLTVGSVEFNEMERFTSVQCFLFVFAGDEELILPSMH